MGVPARAITRDFIETVRGVGKERYIDEYIAAKLAIYGCRPYADKTEFDDYLDIWARPRSVVQSQFEKDSVLVSTAKPVPLSPLADMRLPYVEELPYLISKGAYEYYPLTTGEQVQSASSFYLNEDWAGLKKGTLFFRRQTNLSDIYLALPDIRWDLETGFLFPSLLFRRPTLRPESGAVARPVLRAALSADDSQALALAITSTTLEVISTLSWATPAGPYVSAAVVIIEAILGAIFQQTDTLAGRLDALGQRIITALTQFQESQNLKDKLKALSAFAEWLRKTNNELNTQDADTFRVALLQPNGILAELNLQINDNAPEKLFALVNTLITDADLMPAPDGDDKGYTSKQRWLFAQNKVAILGYAVTMYILALKLKVTLLARLNFYGYNALNEKIDPETNSDTTFDVLRGEVPRLKTAMAACIANVKARRLQMIEYRSVDCSVAYSREQRAADQRHTWNLGDHDGLYTGSRYDLLVRDVEDHPTQAEFQTNRSIPTHMAPSREFLAEYGWKRHEFIDRGLDDGEQKRGFVVDNCAYGGWDYVVNIDRLDKLRDRHIQEVTSQLQACAKIPAELDKSFEHLLSRWTPQIPEQLPGGRLFIAQWQGKPLADELWSDSHVEVRYLFRLVSVAQRSSTLSNDENSTLWERVCAHDAGSTVEHGRSQPEIKGIPIAGDFLEYVIGIDLYRQFRRDGKASTPRLIGKLDRDDDGTFKADSFVDRRSAENDKLAFKPAAGWSPKIPAQLTTRLAINEWYGKAAEGSLWTDSDTEVRYLFRVEASNGAVSEISPDAVSTEWIRPLKRNEPEIGNIPAGESFMEFVSVVHVFRQFRKGGKTSQPRLIGKLERGEIDGKFAKSLRDKENTDGDQLI